MRRPALHASWDEEIARAIERFPCPSSACWDLYRHCADRSEDLDAAIALAALDPIFAVEVIRYANAAEYGGQGAESLRDAATALGVARLSRLALSYAFRGLAPGALRVYDLSAAEFYRKSVACAAAMEFLYSDCPGAGDRMYTLGLLHALGEIFIDAAISNQVREPIRLLGPTPQKLSAIEESFLGLNQAQVAAKALRTWRFPESIVGPIEQQFSAQPGSKHFDVAQSLTVSRYVATKAVQAGRGLLVNVSGKRHIVFRGKLLSDVFGHALAQCDRMDALGAA